MKIKILHSSWPGIMWSAAIFILLIIPGSDFPSGPDIPFTDKIIHVFLFGVQTYIWCRYISTRGCNQKVLWYFFLIFLSSSIYGIGMEYIQKYFIANRGFELGDIMADIFGSFTGWQVCRSYFIRKQRLV